MGMKDRDVLAGRTRVLVDGSNQRGPGSEPLPEEPYARSLRALFPPSIEVVVVFDTDPPIGSGTRRIVGGVTVVHARAGGGDDAIVQRTATAPDLTLVVTNDIGLRDRVTLLGARAERNDWLRDRIAAWTAACPFHRPKAQAHAGGRLKRRGRRPLLAARAWCDRQARAEQEAAATPLAGSCRVPCRHRLGVSAG